MRLISLNEVVPEMEHAPHKIYMLEFNHAEGELFIFKQNLLGSMQQFDAFSDVNEKTTFNIIGVEGDKQGRDHDTITRTHALVADLRPLGIYVIYWEKPDSPDGLRKALKNPLMSRFSGLLE